MPIWYGPWTQPDDEWVTNFGAVRGRQYDNWVEGSESLSFADWAESPDRFTHLTVGAVGASVGSVYSPSAGAWQVTQATAYAEVPTTPSAYPLRPPASVPSGASFEYEAPSGAYLGPWAIHVQAFDTFADGVPCSSGAVYMRYRFGDDYLPYPGKSVIAGDSALYHAYGAAGLDTFISASPGDLFTIASFTEDSWLGALPASRTISDNATDAEAFAVTIAPRGWYRPPRWRLYQDSETQPWWWTPTATALWTTRQRQTLTGNAGGWATRQRGTGSANGGWPLRHRQTGL